MDAIYIYIYNSFYLFGSLTAGFKKIQVKTVHIKAVTGKNNDRPIVSRTTPDTSHKSFKCSI